MNIVNGSLENRNQTLLGKNRQLVNLRRIAIKRLVEKTLSLQSIEFIIVATMTPDASKSFLRVTSFRTQSGQEMLTTFDVKVLLIEFNALPY